MSYLIDMDKETKRLLQELVALVGEREARRFLMAEGLGASTTGEMAAGRYDHRLGELTRQAVVRAHKKARRVKAS